MSDKKRVPKLRFPGFTEPWEQRKLLSCIQSITDFRGRTPKKLGMDWSESGYLALSALNVKDGYIDFSQDVHYGNQELYDKWMSGKELHRGQVLFTTEAPMGNVAQVPDNKGYILSQRTIAFDVEEEILSENFLATLLRTPNVFNNLTALSSGGTAKGVSQKSLSGLDVVIPKNIDEQNKLADYFINLDNLITLHQRKLEHVKKMKKSMLQKMFPKKNQLYPEVRFPGFTDAWEQRKLLSCIQSITDFRGRTPKKLGMDWSESGYLALSALNVKDGYIDFSQDVHYGNQELYDKWMSGKELHRGQVLFTTEAPMGNVAQVPDNKGYILSQRTIAFDVEEEILSENFLATLLRTPNVFNNLTALSSGGTAKGVSQKSLSGLDVVIPKNIDEQNKLADYFINLDNLITLHQRELNHLQLLKKGMLQQMFI